MSDNVLAAGAVPTAHPVDVTVVPALQERNRLTCAFRPILAIPHLILVGGPFALAVTWFGNDSDRQLEWGGAGVLGAVAAVAAIIGWFAIVFTGRQPSGLWNLASFYMHWRVRALAYVMLLRDEYPPFGEGIYPARLGLSAPHEPRDRVSVAFRIVLAIPHLLVLWVLGIGWAFSTLVAWFAILFTGSYPKSLYDFAVGVLRWTTRVEAYLLLMHDAYPPFSLD